MPDESALKKLYREVLDSLYAVNEATMWDCDAKRRLDFPNLFRTSSDEELAHCIADLFDHVTNLKGYELVSILMALYLDTRWVDGAFDDEVKEIWDGKFLPSFLGGTVKCH